MTMDPSLAHQLSLLPRLNRANVGANAVPCKVCDSPAAFFDVVDFNKHTGGYAFGPSGIYVPWHRCDNCGFLFTTFFDDWSTEDFRRFIYNDDYKILDPEYLSGRAQGVAANFARFLAEFKSARILDYGAGSAAFASRMQELGFPGAESYDPFSLPTRPEGRFDFISCIEVIEHAPSPQAILSDMRSFLADDGCILLIESLQPPDIDRVRCGWWYVAPRNGHTSIYASRTFARVAQQADMIFHRSGTPGFPHVLRSGTRFAALARRSGPPRGVARLCAPGQWPAKGYSGVEGTPGARFQWTVEPELSWTIEIVEAASHVLIMIPFAHESRGGFAASCVIEVNGQALPTSVQERSICAETDLMAAGEALVTLRTDALTVGERTLGLAIRAD
jgi:SAM-dependent methyltransferase